jgi:hypothetical protein
MDNYNKNLTFDTLKNNTNGHTIHSKGIRTITQ